MIFGRKLNRPTPRQRLLMTCSDHRSKVRPSQHDGAAVVEVALTLPLLVLVALATLDTCQVLYLKQSAKIAAYEGARISLIAGATPEDVELQCEEILDARFVEGYQIDVPPLQGLVYGEKFKVSVSVPADHNSLVSSWFYRGRVFTEQVVVMVEK